MMWEINLSGSVGLGCWTQIIGREGEGGEEIYF